MKADLSYWGVSSVDEPLRLARCTVCGRWVCGRRQCRKAWAVR